MKHGVIMRTRAKKVIRDYQIDVLKALGIIFVIAGHTGSPFRLFFYAFHMPLFFFVSGFLRNNSKKDKIQWGKFTISRLKTSLLPYFVFWVISYLFLFVEAYFKHTPLPEMLNFNNIKGLLLGGHWLNDYSNNFSLWYFQFYFLAVMVFEVIVRYFNKYFKSITFIALFFIIIPFQKAIPGRPIFHINILPAALFFMLFGYFIKYIIDNKIFSEFKSNIPVGCLFLVIGWHFSSRKYSNVAAINSYSYIVGACLLIIGFYIISSLLVNRKSLIYVGGKTMYILGLHLLVKEVCYNFSRFIVTSVEINNELIYNCIVVLSDLLVCCGLAELFLFVKNKIVKEKLYLKYKTRLIKI